MAVQKVWVLAAGAAAFTVAVTGCGGTGAVAPRNPPSVSATAPAAPAATTGAPPSTSRHGGAENLRASPHVLAQLVSAFAAGQHLRSSDVARTKPGSVYYAFMPSTATYWALADFVPSAQAIAQSHEAASGGPLVQF